MSIDLHNIQMAAALTAPSLILKKPMAFFDLETTGINITTDRIVEISIVKVMPNGEKIIKTGRVNPTIPNSPEATLIHGITDEELKNEPKFSEVANSYYQFLQGCDLAGFNILRFDVPVLVEEFLRCDIDFDTTHRKMVDVQRIFHMMEPRTLSAAYKFYCSKELEGAHGAEADALATYEVLKYQLLKYHNTSLKDEKGKEYIPVVNDMNALHALTANQFADLAGRICYNDKKEEVFNFGKYKNAKVVDVFDKDPAYYDWIMKGDFSLNTKKKVTEIKLRKFNQKK